MIVLAWTAALACAGWAWGGGLEGKVIVVDPGHAVRTADGTVINSGVTGRGGVRERDVVLGVGERLRHLLQEEGARVVMTRDQESPWRTAVTAKEDNRARGELANTERADAFIRLHCDWKPRGKVQGAATYYYRDNSTSLARVIQEQFVRGTGQVDLGIHRLYLVGFAATTQPAVCVEIGCLSSREDEKRLADAEFQERAARAIVLGLQRRFRP